MVFDNYDGDMDLVNRSMYKQIFCHRNLIHEPKKFLFKKTENLNEILNDTRIHLKDDLRFGKILYTYLCCPSYYSLHDYTILMEHYSRLDILFQKIIPQALYTNLIYSAINNVSKYSHGINNLIKLLMKFPFIENIEDYEFKEKHGFDLCTLLFDLIERRVNDISDDIDNYYDEAIILQYGSIDNFLEENINNLSITI